MLFHHCDSEIVGLHELLQENPVVLILAACKWATQTGFSRFGLLEVPSGKTPEGCISGPDSANLGQTGYRFNSKAAANTIKHANVKQIRLPGHG